MYKAFQRTCSRSEPKGDSDMPNPNRKLRVRAGVRSALGVLIALGLPAASGCDKVMELLGVGDASAPAAGAAAPSSAPVVDGTGPKVVPGPGTLPECFAPWSKDTKFLKWPGRQPPFRLALVNGYVGNAWRIQMVKTAKAFAKDPSVAPLIKEFKVVSTGTDIAAQLGAIEDFIRQGFDGIVTLAVSPRGFDHVIELANKRNVVIVPFDNILDTDKVMQVNEDQVAMGRQWGEFIDKQLGGKGKVLEVRGLQGNSTERDRHQAFRAVLGAKGKKYEIVEVVGSWDDAKAQRAVAQAVAAHHKFDAMMVQGGSTGRHPRAHRRGPQAHPRGDGGRKRRAQAHREVGQPGRQGPVARRLARVVGHRHQGHDRRAARQGAAAEDLGAHPGRRRHDAQGRRELLLEALGQLLHAQRVSALRREYLEHQDHERIGDGSEIDA